MKKPISRPPLNSPKAKPNDPSRAGSKGRWEFNAISQSLIALGSTEGARRAAYRTATGELRFLPL